MLDKFCFKKHIQFKNTSHNFETFHIILKHFTQFETLYTIISSLPTVLTTTSLS